MLIYAARKTLCSTHIKIRMEELNIITWGYIMFSKERYRKTRGLCTIFFEQLKSSIFKKLIGIQQGLWKIQNKKNIVELDYIPLMRYGIGTLWDNQRTRLCLIWINCTLSTLNSNRNRCRAGSKYIAAHLLGSSNFSANLITWRLFNTLLRLFFNRRHGMTIRYFASKCVCHSLAARLVYELFQLSLTV